MNVNRQLASLRKHGAEAIRTTILLALRPTADVLPRRWAYALARCAGILVAGSPSKGKRARTVMQKMFGFSQQEASRTLQAREARPFQDFVVLRRVVRGREQCKDWRVREAGDVQAMQLKASGRPFLIATGHFARESFLGVLLPEVLPHRIGLVAAPVPPRALNPYAIRTRLQYGQILCAMQRLRPQDLTFMFTGGFALRLDNRLSEKNSVVMVSVDAYWNGGGAYLRNGNPVPNPPGVHTLSFAGIKDYRVATGAASLARFAQCPIVTCVTYMEDDGGIVVEWGTPIAPPDTGDRAADGRITDQLLRQIERAVGARPSQYVIDIGFERHWNSAAGEWEG